MAESYPSLLQIAAVSTAFKILLFPAYKSTDFEVHRNWLAITNSLSIKHWYYEARSEWTLDYPPFFAYFEWALSQLAGLIDKSMVRVENLGYDSWAALCFQRSSVIVTELVLVYALHLYTKTAPVSTGKQAHAVSLSILLSPGLLIIDHIHFQYNGFLYGILILSLVLARKESTILTSAILFAGLLCLKHIYLYLAPAYFVYLLRTYCLHPKNVFRPQIYNILTLGTSIIAIFALAIGPFVAWGQLEQLKSRLFPFARGLCHAYWAPNVWAMYSFTDRILIILAPYLKLDVNREALQSVTRGLVGNTSFAVLPNITPGQCFAITLSFQAIALAKLWMRPSWDMFVSAVTLCGYASFLFGWHVHEKAILLVLIPFSLLALKDRRWLSAFRPLAVAGHISLFPLLFTAAEFPIKVGYTVAWLILFMYVFDRLAPVPAKRRVFLLDRFSLLYIAVSIPLIAYCSLVHRVVFGDGYEFLPLMFTSSYCAVGVVGSWIGFQVVYFAS
jgi:alpha-1,3-glucosyltransferase